MTMAWPAFPVLAPLLLAAFLAGMARLMRPQLACCLALADAWRGCRLQLPRPAYLG
jgi:hypothetical protein